VATCGAWAKRRQKEAPKYYGNVLHFDSGGSYTGLYICENLQEEREGVGTWHMAVLKLHVYKRKAH
jgi:hypothetical protein